MRRERADRWFYASGVISLCFTSVFFFGLIAYMTYRAPVIRVGEFEETEVNSDWLAQQLKYKQVMQVSIDLIAPQADKPKEAAPPQPSEKKTIKDLFSETNVTTNLEDLLLPASVEEKVAKVNDTPETRKEPDDQPELTQFTTISTVQYAKGDTTLSEISGEINAYYLEVRKRLRASFMPIETDLGKIAIVEVRIAPNGAFEYKFKSESGDPTYKDRVEAAVLEAQKIGLPPPPKGKQLKIEVNFKVEETQ
ncbi:MAG: TonB C-terminal domain-containing protein [Helicobacteraceae bacterium]|jgi:hypothetical protein|nr:TonB C-terminal domain-containing protein [Helicobacteraceae bacterium]